MAAKSTASQAAKLAAEAHSNLNLFASVLALMESGLVYGNSGDSQGVTARKIIALCKAETRKQLTVYDRHIAAIRVGKKG